MWAMCVAPKYGAASRMFKTTEGTTSHLTKVGELRQPSHWLCARHNCVAQGLRIRGREAADKSTFRFFLLSRLVLPSLVTF